MPPGGSLAGCGLAGVRSHLCGVAIGRLSFFFSRGLNPGFSTCDVPTFDGSFFRYTRVCTVFHSSVPAERVWGLSDCKTLHLLIGSISFFVSQRKKTNKRSFINAFWTTSTVRALRTYEWAGLRQAKEWSIKKPGLFWPKKASFVTISRRKTQREISAKGDREACRRRAPINFQDSEFQMHGSLLILHSRMRNRPITLHTRDQIVAESARA